MFGRTAGNMTSVETDAYVKEHNQSSYSEVNSKRLYQYFAKSDRINVGVHNIQSPKNGHFCLFFIMKHAKKHVRRIDTLFCVIL